MSSDTRGRYLRDFHPVFQKLEAARIEFVLVAGQAVNFWAEYYVQSERELEGFRPYLSKDADLIIDVGQFSDLEAVLQGKVVRSASPVDGQLAIFVPEKKDDPELDLIGLLYGLGWRDQKRMMGRVIRASGLRVIDPIYLLRCKLSNLSGLPQGGRNDTRHVQILIPVVRAYLREILSALTAAKLTPRAVIREFKFLLEFQKIRSCREGLKLADRDLTDALPWEAIEGVDDPKFRAFADSDLAPLKTEHRET